MIVYAVSVLVLIANPLSIHKVSQLLLAQDGQEEFLLEKIEAEGAFDEYRRSPPHRLLIALQNGCLRHHPGDRITTEKFLQVITLALPWVASNFQENWSTRQPVVSWPAEVGAFVTDNLSHTRGKFGLAEHLAEDGEKTTLISAAGDFGLEEESAEEEEEESSSALLRTVLVVSATALVLSAVALVLVCCSAGRGGRDRSDTPFSVHDRRGGDVPRFTVRFVWGRRRFSPNSGTIISQLIHFFKLLIRLVF